MKLTKKYSNIAISLMLTTIAFSKYLPSNRVNYDLAGDLIPQYEPAVKSLTPILQTDGGEIDSLGP